MSCEADKTIKIYKEDETAVKNNLIHFYFGHFDGGGFYNRRKKESFY